MFVFELSTKIISENIKIILPRIFNVFSYKNQKNKNMKCRQKHFEDDFCWIFLFTYNNLCKEKKVIFIYIFKFFNFTFPDF